MRVQLFSVPFNAQRGAFEDEAMQAFMQDHAVTGVTEHFFMQGDQPWVLFTLRYNAEAVGLLASTSTPQSATKPALVKEKAGQKEPWREALSDKDLPLFEHLRQWRRQVAAEHGVPPYVVFTNAHLAQLVTERPSSLAGLAKINGIGKAKIDKYGQNVLDQLTKPLKTHE